MTWGCRPDDNFIELVQRRSSCPLGRTFATSTRLSLISRSERPHMPLMVCVCGGPATRGTENTYRGGCTVDTTTGGRAYVACTTLRPSRPHGRRSGRRDRLLRGAGPGVEGRTFVEGEFLDTVCGIPDSRTEIVMLKSPEDGVR